MKGDFTRFSFDPSKHYYSVRMQQGRVQLDSDWNEQIDTQTRQQQIVTTDLIGVTAAPIVGGGFQVTISSDGQHVLFSAGHMYVGGLLCELNAQVGYDQQTDFPGAVYPTLSHLNPLGVGNWTPGTDTSGNYVFLAYLDAWPRHVTAIEDPNVAEVALGGPDTGTRVQTLAQLKLVPLSSDGTVSPPNPVPNWSSIIAPSQAQLAAAAFLPDSPGSLELGYSGYVTLPTTAFPMESGSPNFSQGFAVEAWVFVSGTNTTGVPILYLSDVTSGSSPNTLSLTGGTTNGTTPASLTFMVGTTTYVATGVLVPGQWAHVAASIMTVGTGPVATLYVNGSSVPFTTTGSVALPPNVARPHAYLGSNNGSAGSFLALFAEVRVWAGTAFTGPLVSSRIAPQNGLVGYYKLNETGTSVVYDSSSATAPGAVTGSAIWSTNGPALAAAGTTTAQYLGAENQLYRVEIHSVVTTGGGSPVTTVTFKWSRDNGSVASSAKLSVSGASTYLTLATPVRDDVLGWSVGQWVEVTTVTGDIQGAVGTPAQISAVVGQILTIDNVIGTLPPAGTTVTVRRWDSNFSTSTFTLLTASVTVATQTGWLPLESGIAVQFSGVASGTIPIYKPGDYWLLPARTVTQAIEWSLGSNTQPASLLPLGVKHQYAQLAKVYLTSAGTWVASPFLELRATFPSLQNVVQASGALTWNATTVQVSGTMDVGTTAIPQTLNVYGPLNAYDGINVTGAPLNVGTDGANQPLTVFGVVTVEGNAEVAGLLTAYNGINVINAPANIGGTGAPQTLNVFGPLNANDGLNVTGGTATIGSPPASGFLLVYGTATVTNGLTVEGAPTQIGTPAANQPLNVYGLVNANDGLLVQGSAAVIGTSGSPQQLNVTGAVNAGNGINVTGAGVVIGSSGTPLPLSVSGTLQAQGVVNVTGALNAAGAVNAAGLLSAENGINVTGAGVNIGFDGVGGTLPLTVFGGLSAYGGVSVQSVLTAYAGLTVQGAALNVGTPAAPQTLNAYGQVNAELGLTVTNAAINAEAGLSVTNAALNVGSVGSPQNLNLSNWPNLITAKTLNVHCLEIMATNGSAQASFSTATSGAPACILLPSLAVTTNRTWIRLLGLPNGCIITQVAVTMIGLGADPTTTGEVLHGPTYQLLTPNLVTGSNGNVFPATATTDAHVATNWNTSVTTTIAVTGSTANTYNNSPTGLSSGNIYVLAVTHPYTVLSGTTSGIACEISDIVITVTQSYITNG